MEDRIGRVAEGFTADLIVVDGDPLRGLTILGEPDGRRVDLVMQARRDRQADQPSQSGSQRRARRWPQCPVSPASAAPEANSTRRRP
ncbi:hypothetical protein MI170_05485 [Mycolicibacterium goodii]|nr:hypothetical protein [Mycolicibacterium goodii]ULN48834.1 hypothetical protein MI170_05485 [Mycolicibacterium goodii]